MAVALLVGVAAILVGPAVGDLVESLTDRTAVATPVPTTAPSGAPTPTDVIPSSPATSPGPPSGSFDPAITGRIRFGSAPGADRCSVADPIDSPIEVYSAADPVFIAAVLRQPAASDDQLRVLIASGGSEFETVRETQDPARPRCRANRDPIGPLAPGIYIFVVFNGSRGEAEGVLRVE